MSRRVVITGVGLVSPLAVGTEATWSALIQGKSGIRTIQGFDPEAFASKIAGEVPDFDPTQFLNPRAIRRTDAFIRYALAAAQFAVDDADFSVESLGGHRVGVVIGSGVGGLQTIEDNLRTLVERGPRRVSPFLIPSLAANMAAGHVSIRFGATGPNAAPATACTTGLHAIGDAARLIRYGYADAMIAGGTEAPVTPLGISGFTAMKALSTRNDEPERASRPWDRDRDGFVIAEGAGVVVLEELDAARSRGAEIYAEVAGYGMSGDAHHISAPHPEGEGAAEVMRLALADARLGADGVQYINAHGTSTPLGDISEVRAIRTVFGAEADGLAVSSTKSATGHLLGAAGGLETGILALAVRHQTVPPTLNLEHPGEGCDLDFVPGEAREMRLDAALTNSFGFGGTNGALVLARYTG